MSYDLVVFDPSVAPRDREAFLQWFDAFESTEEPRDVHDPEMPTTLPPSARTRRRAKCWSASGSRVNPISIRRSASGQG